MTATQLSLHAAAVRVAGPGDAEALLELHRTGFGPAWQMRHWRWRFVANPLGRTDIVGAFTPDGRCLASFCGVPLPCRYAGEPGLAHAAGDVVVHPQLRVSAAGATLLLRVATQFFATFGGGPVRIVFGFPQPQLCRLITRHCRVEVLADVAVLVRDAVTAPPPSGLVVRIDERLPADVEPLSARWHQDVTTGVVRDARYLQWRYADSPHARYRFATARAADGTLRGLAVLRPDAQDDDATLIVEWLVPRADRDATHALLGVATQFAIHERRPNLVIGFAGASPEFASFQRDHGFRVVVSEHRFVCRTYHPDVDRRFLFRNWQFSLGDMDCT